MKRFKKFIKYYLIFLAAAEIYWFRYQIIYRFYDSNCIYKQAIRFIAYRYTFLLLVPIYIWTFLKIRSSSDEPFFKPLTPAVTWTLFYIFTCNFFSYVDFSPYQEGTDFSPNNIFNLRLDLIFYVLFHPKEFIDFIISRLS